MPFITGLVIALLIEPMVRFLTERGRFKRSLASFVLLFILMMAGVSVGRWGALTLYREASEFLDAAPDYLAALQELTGIELLNRAGEWISERSIRAAGHLPRLLIGLLLVLLSAYYFSRDREMIFGLVLKYCPDWLERYGKAVWARLHRAALGFLKSECILFALVAAACIAGLWFLKAPYVIMLGLVIALFDSLPIVGSGLILWPWAGYLALTGNHPQAAGLMVLYGVIAVIRNVLGPRILGDQIDMHPLAAIAAIFLGIKIFGAIGILAGPALVIAVQAIFEERSKCTKPK